MNKIKQLMFRKKIRNMPEVYVGVVEPVDIIAEATIVEVPLENTKEYLGEIKKKKKKLFSK